MGAIYFSFLLSHGDLTKSVTEAKLTNDATKAGSSQDDAQAAALQKMAADSTSMLAPKAPEKSGDKPAEKPPENPSSKAPQSSFDLGGLFSSALNNAELLAESAYDCLPSLRLSDASTTAAAAAKTTDQAAGKPTDKEPAKPAPNEGEKAAPAASATAQGSLDMRYLNQSFSIDDFLKQQGCDDQVCKVNSDDNAKKMSTDFGDFTVVSAKDKDTAVNDKNNTAVETLMDKQHWQDFLATFEAQTGHKIDVKFSDQSTQYLPPVEMTDASKDRVEKTSDGYKLVDEKGKADVERKGDLSIRQNADGTRSELNTKTGEETVYNADGKVKFKRLLDGSIETPLNDKGDFMVMEPDGNHLHAFIGNRKENYVLKNRRFVIETSNVEAKAEDGAVPDAKTLAANASKVLDGHYKVTTYSDGTMVENADGSYMVAKKDGSGIISLDKHSWMVRTKDGHIEIHYNDSRPTVLVSDEQLKKMASDPASVANIKAAFEALRNFSATGVLKGHSNTSITTQGGKIVARANGVETSRGDDGSLKVHDHNTKAISSVSADGRALTVMDENGKPLGTFRAVDDGIKAEQAGITVKPGGVVTTEDGTVYSGKGIKFADGTEFKMNGDITTSSGTTYNIKGEVISCEKTGSAGEGTSSKQSDESKAKAQVSHAESIASSILGKVAGGHATAGDIAALLSSFEKLGNLVSVLAQGPDSSLMATAVIAQGEVGSSIAMAYGNLNDHIDKVKKGAEDRDKGGTSAQQQASLNLAAA